MRRPLTPREVEILSYVAQGLPNKEIAARLGIAEGTLKSAFAVIFGKTGAYNRTGAVVEAIRIGAIKLPAEDV